MARLRLRERFLPDAEATRATGQWLASGWPRPLQGVIWLQGELGAGKTELARAFLRTLGVTGPIKSPTYTLVEPYTTAAGSVLHMDCYRLASAEELDMLGLADTPPETALWLVEWPERALAGLPPPDLRLQLSLEGEGRRLRLEWQDNSRLQGLLQEEGE